MMNLMYENFPEAIDVCGDIVPIVTDFREYIKLIDMLADSELSVSDKQLCILQYFKSMPCDFDEALGGLVDFVTMSKLKPDLQSSQDENKDDDPPQKALYSFSYDYPYIFSAFMHDYGINIRTIPYMHWWEFRMLFDGLSNDNEIKQRIMYRGIDPNDVKDKDERKRIMKIQREIKLPDDILTDYDIGDVFEW